MSAKVFVLGRPGSGKSTAARRLRQLLAQRGWIARHINDYEILRRMFLADTQQIRFRPTEHNGFDAIDLTVMDLALQEVEVTVCANLCSADLATIEFARNDYREALQQFSASFLKDAYFLFLDADLETCLRRVHERVMCSSSIDDHPSFSDAIFRSYYQKENGAYMAVCLQREFCIHKQVRVINNTGSLNEFMRCIEQFADEIFRREAYGSFLADRMLAAGLLTE
ncbi:MAG: AAA family ATPase [Ktedonobacteraceae bacterium]|nr:AAA family ATPase [Ktedonobacteraceae bacterium]